MRDETRERAVVGQEQQTLGLDIQAPHRLDAAAQAARDEVEDGVPSPLVGDGRDEPARLVEQQVGARAGRRADAALI
jgi:hypothetical protein